MKINLPGIRIHHVTGTKAICFCPIHKGGTERSPSMEIRLDTARWRCYACSPESKPLVELLTGLGVPLNHAKELASSLKVFSTVGPPVGEGQTKHTCPERLLGQFLGRRPKNLLRAGYSREILDEMEIGWDSSRHRVIYPIRDAHGVLLGVVGGAALPKDDPKYVAYYGAAPKYVAYGPREGFPFQVNPKWSLWNYHRVIDLGESGNPIVVVEGYKALMWVRMAGWKRVVALCGASFTGSQLDMLGRLGGPYLIFLDNDDTGRLAARKLTIELRRRASYVKIVKYPRDVAQPDDLTLHEVNQALGVSDGTTEIQPRKDRDPKIRPLETDQSGVGRGAD